MLSEPLISLQAGIPCRNPQITQLATLLDPSKLSPPVLVIHGLESTGKTLVTKSVLAALKLPRAVINCRECVTARHLLERTVMACKQGLGEDMGVNGHEAIDGRCESLSALLVQLQQLFEGIEKFVLVFDGIDRQREAPPTLLPAIARLGELIFNLTVVMIVAAPQPRLLQFIGVPHIHFLPYNRSDVVTIVSRSPLPIFGDADHEELSDEKGRARAEDDLWLWSRFCGAVWDSLGKHAARNLPEFDGVCRRLWPPFVLPIRTDGYGTREFSKLMVRNRALFQDEAFLITNIIPPTTTTTTLDTPKPAAQNPAPLPYYTKYLLLAAYLASYNPSRQDQVFFMKAHETTKKRRQRKKGAATATSGRPSQHRKIKRSLLGPQPFVLERLLAIFHAIVPHPVPAGAADLMTEIATLASLRMVVKTSATADVLEAGTKWRVNVGWEFVRLLGRGLKFDLEDYLAE